MSDQTTANRYDALLAEHPTMKLTLEDDATVECTILNIFECEGKEYIALLPLDESGESQDGEVYLYTFSLDEDGSPVLGSIQEDEEYNTAARCFQKQMNGSVELEES